MKKIISYSLYGSNPFYSYGAVVNAKQAHEFYPDWLTRFYVGKSIPQEIICELRNANAEVIPMQGDENNFASMWRFLVFTDPNVEIALLRDTDSRFSKREVFAVEEWLKTDKNFHIMRDHPCHDMPIMAGMWGAKCSALRNIKTQLQNQNQKNSYGADQFFLRKTIYPLTLADACIHASFWAYEKEAKPFPTLRNSNEFVGERIDEYEQACMTDRAMIKKYTNSLPHKFILHTKFYIKKSLLQLRNFYVMF